MRQIGKSTLLKHFSKRYYTFDDDAFAGEFQRNAQVLLTLPHFPLAIDEIQKHPPAFDALKYAIDNHKVPGRFLISGSVRFASRKAIRESLTGRVMTINLLPMSLAECHQKALSRFIEKALQRSDKSLTDSIKRAQWTSENTLLKYAEQGGMPGICFARDQPLRKRYFESHLDTLLGRDIQLIRRTSLSVLTLLRLFRELAALQGSPINLAALARNANTSIPTLKNTLEAFEGLFLIRPYGETYYIEDLGLSHFVHRGSDLLDRKSMIKILFHEFRTQLNLTQNLSADMQPYSTRGGIDIPFVITTADSQTLAIAVDDSEDPSEKSLKGLTWFCKKNPTAKKLILCRRKEPITMTNGTLCLPWTWVF